jgi:Phage integrase family
MLLSRLAAKAGIEKRVHPHGLRHTHAAELAAEGMPLNFVQAQLGALEPRDDRPLPAPHRARAADRGDASSQLVALSRPKCQSAPYPSPVTGRLLSLRLRPPRTRASARG